ncbi:MAG: 16S rRNA (uracil(1498)-N(3))-methyltransferase [Planctomycetes bacterium]|nr:16S rRNA (uracil(1498)-N(3))-methyltransferase [Planctomycetota bacterium]
MADRYYCAEPIQGSSVTLSGSEAHHLLHVMRAQPGLELVLFDGCGGEYRAEVVRCKRSTVELVVGPQQEIERELPFALTLAVALPKGDRQRWLIEKAVELGVTRLVPLRTARSVGNPKPERLNRYVIEASKQCGRNRLMELASACGWDEFETIETRGSRVFAHPGGVPFGQIGHDGTSDLTIAVGPEGGFTDEEAASAEGAGWAVVGLGSRILRIETAAVALVAAATTA